MGNTKIEWSTKVWNPVTGCTPISEGCEHCYAQRMANRLRGRCGYPEDEPFRVTFHENKINEPSSWKKPQRIFVCSMGDLFHEDVNTIWIDSLLEVFISNPKHVFMLLTKRPQRMFDYFDSISNEFWPLSNLWLGVTAENQARADERIPILLQIPAAKRFVSIEPMLGPVDLRLRGNCHHCFRYGQQYHITHPCEKCGYQGGILPLDWVILGGETGPGAQPMHPDWVRSVRDQCQAAGVPFFFKSWGKYIRRNGDYHRITKGFPKHILDGQEYRGVPS